MSAGLVLLGRRERILEALRGGPLSTTELAEATGIHFSDVRDTCSRLILDGEVTRSGGGRGLLASVIYQLGTGTTPVPQGGAGQRIDRDPCFKCGVRGDLGCAHRRAGAYA